MEEPPDPGDAFPPGQKIRDASFDQLATDVGMKTPTDKSSVKVIERRKIHSRKRNLEKTAPLTSVTTSSIKDDTKSFVDKNKIPLGRREYNDSDNAPYVIHVVREQVAPNDGTTLHPLIFGRFLKKNNVVNIINGSVKRIGRNRISLSFSNFNDANTFINLQNLEKHKMKAFIPTFSITRMGVVRGIPVEWTDDDIVEHTNIPNGYGKILKVRRFNYKTYVDGSPVWKPSQTVVLTFDGKTLPKHVYMCYNSVPVELYTFPTILCYNCCRFGHTKNQCRSKPRCYKCAQEHSGDSCSVEEENALCCNCSDTHFASHKSCPEFIRQTKIKVSMAEQSISYAEASKLHPSIGKSYAAVLATPTPVHKPNSVSSFPSHIGSPSSCPKSSHTKTIFRIPKPKSPEKNSKGYDRQAHQALVKDYNMPSGTNGSAFIKSDKNISVPTNQPFIESLTSLWNIAKGNNLQLPSDAVETLNNYFHYINSMNNNMKYTKQS